MKRLLMLAVLFFALSLSGWAQMTASPTSLSFGNQPDAVASNTLTVTLTNTSTSSITISSVTFTGPYAPNFYQSNTCGTGLGPGAQCTVNVEIAPSDAGVRTASLVVTSTAPNSPLRVPVSGTGIHDIVLVWPASPTPGVVGYYVYRGTAAGKESATPLNSTPVNALFYVDIKQLVGGVTYYYYVTAVASNGVTQSGPSPEAHATQKKQSSYVVN